MKRAMIGSLLLTPALLVASAGRAVPQVIQITPPTPALPTAITVATPTLSQPMSVSRIEVAPAGGAGLVATLVPLSGPPQTIPADRLQIGAAPLATADERSTHVVVRPRRGEEHAARTFIIAPPPPPPEKVETAHGGHVEVEEEEWCYFFQDGKVTCVRLPRRR